MASRLADKRSSCDHAPLHGVLQRGARRTGHARSIQQSQLRWPRGHSRTPWHCRTPHSPDTTATPEPLVTASTAHAADIPETSDIPSPAGAGIPSTWAPILDAPTAPPSSSGAHEDTLTTWDTTRLGASPSQELSTEGTNPHAADAGEPEPLAFNPEAFERTMTPALLEELR